MVDNYEWLQAIDDHPHMTTEDLVGAYAFLGTETDRTPEQVDAAVFSLVVYGFLKPVAINDDTWTYELLMPALAA
jgi:hypothetical protein